MTPDWRQLETDIADIARIHTSFPIRVSDGEVCLVILDQYGRELEFSLTLFAKELHTRIGRG